MAWTKEEQEQLKKFGTLVGEAKFTITGEQAIDLYRGLVVLAKVNKIIGDELAGPGPVAAPTKPVKKR